METTQTWIKELKLARRNGQDSSGKAKGLKGVSKVHANRQDKGNLGRGQKGLKVVSKVHANRKDKVNLGKQGKRIKSRVKGTRNCQDKGNPC
jgi:hypothetical protein